MKKEEKEKKMILS